MADLWRTFMECGSPAWVVLFLTALGCAAGTVALGVAIIRPRAGLAVAGAALVLAVSAPGAGVIGQHFGRQKVDAVVSDNSIDPSMAERIRAEGYSEAAQCVKVGVGGGSVPFLIGALALIVALVRRKATD